MAYDIFTKKTSSRNWGIGSALPMYSPQERQRQAEEKKKFLAEVVRWQKAFTPPAKPFTTEEQEFLIRKLRGRSLEQQAETVFAGKPFSDEQAAWLSKKLGVDVPRVSPIPVASNVLTQPIGQPVPRKTSGGSGGPILIGVLAILGLGLAIGSAGPN